MCRLELNPLTHWWKYISEMSGERHFGTRDGNCSGALFTDIVKTDIFAVITMDSTKKLEHASNYVNGQSYIERRNYIVPLPRIHLSWFGFSGRNVWLYRTEKNILRFLVDTIVDMRAFPRPVAGKLTRKAEPRTLFPWDNDYWCLWTKVVWSWRYAFSWIQRNIYYDMCKATNFWHFFLIFRSIGRYVGWVNY